MLFSAGTRRSTKTREIQLDRFAFAKRMLHPLLANRPEAFFGPKVILRDEMVNEARQHDLGRDDLDARIAQAGRREHDMFGVRIDIDADADHHPLLVAAALIRRGEGFEQDAAQLLAVQQNIVGPFAGDGLSRLT